MICFLLSRVKLFHTAASVCALLPLLLVSTSSSFAGKFLIGDFSSVSDMDPKVVLNFLSTCTDEPVDTSSCLVSTFIADTFGQGKWGDRCTRFSIPQIETSVMNAFNACGDADIEARNAFARVLAYNECWPKLCDPKTATDIESSWIRSCANIYLPSSQVKYEGMSSVEPDEQEVVLSCMLHEVMASDPLEFGLPNVSGIETCYPPGYNTLDSVCNASLARITYDRCSFLLDDEQADAGDQGDDGVMSMAYGNAVSEGDIAANFCALLAALSSPDNQECLVALCNYSDAPFSSLPSIAPTNSVPVYSAAPSSVPSGSPTYASVQAIIKIEILSSFTVSNISTFDIPTNTEDMKRFFGVFADAVSAVTSNVQGDIIISVDTDGGMSPGSRLRHLIEAEDTIEVEINTTMYRDCYVSDCTDPSLSNAAAGDFTGALLASMPDPLTQKIHGIAEERGVQELLHVYVGLHLNHLQYESHILDPTDIIGREALSAGYIVSPRLLPTIVIVASLLGTF